MKILLAFSLTLALLLAATAAGADPVASGPFAAAEPFSVPGIFEVHDKFPQRYAVKQAEDSECNENHHLQPDGDADCDDPKVGVPEPGAWGSTGLLALGVAGVYLSGRRRRG